MSDLRTEKLRRAAVTGSSEDQARFVRDVERTRGPEAAVEEKKAFEIREGDIFRWYYKVPPDKFEPYWCKSRIAIVKNGWLEDTYWCGGADNSKWTIADAREQLDLTYVANMNDLVPADRNVRDDHRPEDIVDLSHPNRPTEFYLRKGAQRSMEVQRATWERARDEALRKADYYQGLLDRHPLEQKPLG